MQHLTPEEIEAERKRQADMLDAIAELRKGRERLMNPIRRAHLEMRAFLEGKGVTIDPDIAAMQRRSDAPDAETLARRMEKLRAQREARK